MSKKLIADIEAAFATHSEYRPTTGTFATRTANGYNCCALGGCYLAQRGYQYGYPTTSDVFTHFTDKYEVDNIFLNWLMDGFDNGHRTKPICDALFDMKEVASAKAGYDTGLLLRDKLKPAEGGIPF